jgi:hypothetical protein
LTKYQAGNYANRLKILKVSLRDGCERAIQPTCGAGKSVALGSKAVADYRLQPAFLTDPPTDLLDATPRDQNRISPLRHQEIIEWE